MKALTMLLLTMMFQTSYSQGIGSDRVGAPILKNIVTRTRADGDTITAVNGLMTLVSGGSDYVIGDTLFVDGGDSTAIFVVETVGISDVTSFYPAISGTSFFGSVTGSGYVSGTTYATTTNGVGVNCTVKLLSIFDTLSFTSGDIILFDSTWGAYQTDAAYDYAYVLPSSAVGTEVTIVEQMNISNGQIAGFPTNDNDYLSSSINYLISNDGGTRTWFALNAAGLDEVEMTLIRMASNRWKMFSSPENYRSLESN
jgi:hypothetical protein